MSWFTAPPAVIAPAIQREIATAAHELIGVAISLIQSGAVGINNGKPENILQLAQRLKKELGVDTGTVETSPIYRDATPQNRQEVSNRLRMMRAFLDGAIKKAQNPLLLERGVTTEKTVLTDDIHEDFVQVLYQLRGVTEILKKSEQQRAA